MSEYSRYFEEDQGFTKDRDAYLLRVVGWVSGEARDELEKGMREWEEVMKESWEEAKSHPPLYSWASH